MILFLRFSLSFLKASPGKLSLTVIGIALGVGLFIAVQLANQTAVKSFQHNEKIFSVDHPLTISSPTRSLPVSLYVKLKQAEFIDQVVPFSSTIVSIPTVSGGTRRVRLYGVDFLKQNSKFTTEGTFHVLSFLASSDSVLISQPLVSIIADTKETVIQASNHSTTLKIAGIVAPEQSFEKEFLVTDIGHYQDITRSYAVVDQFNVKANDGISLSRLRELLKDLPADIRVQTSEATRLQTERASAAFRLNIQFLALFSLVIAVLLVYNFVSFLVLKRRSQFGALRSIGVTPRQLFCTVLIEGIALGTVGGLIGFCVGVVFADFVTAQVALTVNNLYVPTPTLVTSPSPTLFLSALLCGILTGAIGAILPGFEVIKSSPLYTLSYQNFERNFRSKTKLFLGVGLITSLLALLFARPSLLNFSLLAGFIPPILFIVGTILLTPSFLTWTLACIRSYSHKQEALSLSLAIGHIDSTLRRNTVSIAAAATTLGMVLGITVMIHSFRGTVQNWIQSVTKADVYISSTGSPAREGGVLSKNLLQFAENLSEVKDVDWIQVSKTTLFDTSIEIRGTRFAILQKYKRLPLTQGTISDVLSETDPVIYISEAFARKYTVALDSELIINGPADSQALIVKGVFADYSSEHGVVLISQKLFKELFNTDEVNGISLYLHNPQDASRITQLIYESFPDATLTIRNKHELRTYVEKVFNETFQITYALQFVTIILAFFIVISTTTMLVIERFNELSMLFSIGASKQQLSRIISIESLLLGLFSAVIGLYLGSGLSLFLVYVVNVFFFGWLVTLAVPFLSIFLLSMAVVLFSWLAGILVGRFYLRRSLFLEEQYG